MKEAKHMFLVTFSIRDGASEHTSYKVVLASTERKARAKALKWAEDYFLDAGTVRDEEDDHLFWSEDGTRTIKLMAVEKTTVDNLIKTLLLME
jgi:hypothetical protein